MLQLITGRAASGKTTEIMNRIKMCVKGGKKSILIVPEQFSFESEKGILDLLKDRDAQKVSVMSFTRICDEAERISGGFCGKTLSDSDKLILMNRAVKQSASELNVWRNYTRSAGFAKKMAEFIGELKINAVTPEELKCASEIIDDGALKSKLNDVINVYNNFELLISERFVDPADRLTKLYYTLENVRLFENCEVFLDSFKGFTGQQFKIIDRILAQCDNLTVSLTDDVTVSDDGIFGNVRRTANRICSIARSHAVKISEPYILKNNYYMNGDMAAVERLIAFGEKGEISNDGNVTVCRAKTVYDEAEFAARNIRRIVRENPQVRYRDFVIIARDTAPYEEALSVACEKNGVGCFIDRRIPLSSLPPAFAVIAAVDAARSLTTEKILRFHKSGIGLLTNEEISIVENYTYLWNIVADKWHNDWDMSPDGFVMQGALSEKSREMLDRINAIRKKAIKPLENFVEGFGETPKEKVRAIINLLDDCNARESFSALENEYRKGGNGVYADAVRQSWDELCNVLDSLVECLPDEEISVSEFYDTLNISISLASVGVIPQMLDEAVFGAADRIRPSRPRFAFILGAQQGVFPQNISNSGIFAACDRTKLINAGIDIPDNSENAALDEDFLVYSSVCCPKEKLFISYSISSADGSAAQPSVFVTQITDCNKDLLTFEPKPLERDNLPETNEGAFSEICRRISSDKDGAKTVESAITDDEARHRIESVMSGRNRQDFKLSEKTACELFGKNLRMSPTRLDNYSRCAFMFFCRDGLKAKRLQPADFDVMQRGTLVHYVLQVLIERHGKGISELEDETICAETDQIIDNYLDNVTGYRSVETERSRFLVFTISRLIKFVAIRLKAEFAQSDFEPVACELKIGADSDIPEIKIPVDEEKNLLLSGIVDRVDRWNGYIRIVDYKTGHRDFKLPDILFGQNMQMLIYLYAICRDKNYSGKAAGIFYMPARRNFASAATDRRMHGIMLANEELVRAMDRENSGEYVPRLPKSGASESFLSDGDFEKIFEYIERKLENTGRDIYGGRIAAEPIDGIDSPACKYCDFAPVCRIENEAHVCVEKMKNYEVMQKIVEGESEK